MAGVFRELEVDKLIDEKLPKERTHNVPHSVCILAMVLNGLGFVGQRLYLFPDFFKNISTERLFGDGITKEDLNQYAIGDVITSYSIHYTKLYDVEIYDHPQEKVIGKTHSELGRDPEQIKFWEEHHEKVFATGEPETVEFEYTSPQGKKYYFNTQIVPEFVDGEA